MSLIATDNRRIVVGLGQTGLSLARYFVAQGLPFSMADSRLAPPGLAALRAEFPQLDIALGPFDSEQFNAASELVLSPGIPLSEPAIAQAKAAGVKISGDIDYFCAQAQAPIVAITGSNGKSTVTTLVAAMAERAGRNVAVGGNLGTPALALLDAAIELYVLELSSFQLERCEYVAAAVATVLNVSADHLDHHGSMMAYHQAKHRIFRGCQKAVINRDDPLSTPLVPDAVEIWSFRLGRSDFRCFGLLELDGESHIALAGKALMPTAALAMAGRHNLSNALAALALGSAVDLPLAAMLQTLREFPGLAHRCQFVANWQGLRFYNDSKGTNVGAARAAIEGLAEGAKVVLIAGGQGKGGDFQALADSLLRYGRGAVLIGEAAAEIAALLEGRLPLRHCQSMSEAVTAAVELADSGDVVLLSPACASFDMFDNYQHRGEQFCQAVLALRGEGQQ